MIAVLTALSLATLGAPAAPCALHPGESRIAHIVEAAWDEQAAQNAKLAKEQQKHKEELEGDREIGAKYSAQADKELKISKNQEHIDRVNRIGGVLADIANRTPVKVLWGDKRLNPFQYQFKVVENEEVNAFSLPGGFIYVYDGLIKYCESDDELAGVLAHEIAHASFRHLATLQREQSKLDIITLPLILVSLIAGGETGAAGVTLGTLTNQAKASGWSQKAELSADYGGLQYMLKSPYNAVGILTFMEKLARDRSAEFIDWGIYRSHPPSRDRANALEAALRTHEVPIRRSLVAASYRVTTRAHQDSVDLLFADRRLFRLGGADAESRAKELVVRLNEFFDTVPELYEVTKGENGAILYRKQVIVRITEADAKAADTSQDRATADALNAIKRVLYSLAFRIWDIR